MNRFDDRAVLVKALDPGGEGPRVAIKDCIDIAGERTGCGSAAFDDAPPARRHADVVAALLAAGWHITGKANMHELAYGMTGINAHTGTPVNPLYPDRIVGGSSSGCAVAVAGGMADAAIGSDTGGSIRLPAACCGVIGLKPTFGAVPRQGAAPVTSSLDCIGPFARDMATLVHAMTAICPGFDAPEPARDLRIGRVAGVADADIEDALDRALAGYDCRAIELPSLAAAHEAGIVIMAAEMASLFGDLVGTGKLGADIDARLQAGKAITARQVEEAEAVRARFTAEVDAALEAFDVLALPTLPAVPLRVADAGNGAAALRLSALVRPFNLSGHPALTLPLKTREGLPAGLQLVAGKGRDMDLCAAGLALESTAT